MLSINAGRVVTYDSMLRQAWSGNARESGDPTLVRAVVKRLRRKLQEQGGDPDCIRNARRVGYRMPAPGDL